VYRKNFREALRLAERAAEAAELPGVRAEALYLKARVLHQLDDFEDALAYYQQACQAWPELAPAQFGLAQMLAAQSRQLQLRDRGEEAQARLGEAVAALQRVLDKAPNDPDALTLLGLLLAEKPGAAGKQAALERLKKAVELQPEVTEAWVALAQAHQRAPGADTREALRCLQEAERLLLARAEAVPAAVLSNLGALLHVQGRAHEAQAYYVRALEAFARTGRGGLGELERQYLAEEQPIVHPANAVFWQWEETPLRVARPAFGAMEAAVAEAEAEGGGWEAYVKAGDYVKLVLGPGKRDGFVTQVAAESSLGNALRFAHAFLLPPPESTTATAPPESAVPVPVCRKASRGLLRHETLPTVFNLAMIQQDTGELQAARELLVAITRQYPSYVAAYAKLGLLAHAEGKKEDAQEWLDKAQRIAPHDKDVAAARGKMEQDAGRRDQAQKHFEPLNKEGDSYAMVALGNLCVRACVHAFVMVAVVVGGGWWVE
jgi:tetratricopeptide (TPR) repeat protein